jgi:hypothetical protein
MAAVRTKDNAIIWSRLVKYYEMIGLRKKIERLSESQHTSRFLSFAALLPTACWYSQPESHYTSRFILSFAALLPTACWYSQTESHYTSRFILSFAALLPTACWYSQPESHYTARFILSLAALLPTACWYSQPVAGGRVVSDKITRYRTM